MPLREQLECPHARLSCEASGVDIAPDAVAELRSRLDFRAQSTQSADVSSARIGGDGAKWASS